MAPRAAAVGRAVAWALLCWAAVASAQESLDDLDRASKPAAGPRAAADLPMGSTQGRAIAEVNGYLDNRLQLGWARTGGLVPTADLPTLSDLLEANVQLRVTALPSLFLYSDLSVFLQAGGLYYTADASGARVQAPDHDVVSLRPLVVPAELYVSFTPAPWLTLTVGRKRVTWGAGVAFNPSDLIDPPKDPTDPAFQRAGAWIARVEAPFRRFTLTGLFAPSVLYQENGLPYRFLVYPGYPPAGSTTPASAYSPPDGDAHFLAALRLYALLGSSDINLVYYFSNRYRDDADFQLKSRLALSLSRYFGGWELHLEALGQLGTTRRYVDPAVLGGALPPGPLTIDAVLPQRDKATDRPVARLILGTRHTFSDESTLSLEYLYQNDGYRPDELERYVRLLALIKAGGPLSQLGLGAPASGGLPQKFSFDPLRRHYLVAAWMRPRLADDWTVGVTVIVGLEDLSGLVSPAVTWQPREWLSLTLTGFVPFYGLPVGTVCAVAAGADGKCPAGQAQSEFSLSPQDFRALFQARIFY